MHLHMAPEKAQWIVRTVSQVCVVDDINMPANLGSTNGMKCLMLHHDDVVVSH